MALFQKAFGGSADEAVTFENVTKAVAAFERTLLSFNSKFDRYAAGDTAALNEQERSGMKVFRSLKTRCFECHNFPTFADDTFRVIGVPEKGDHDRGRASVPGEGPDGAFKTVTLRNVALTAPYMHNGAFDTLEDVIKFYAKGAGRGEPNPSPTIDDKIGKFDITDAEIADLVAFLKTLTDTSLQPDPPARVPSGLPVVAVKSKAMPAPQLAKAAGGRRASQAATAAAANVQSPAPPVARPASPTKIAAAPAAPRAAAPLGGYSSGNLHRVPGLPSAAGSLAIQNPSPPGRGQDEGRATFAAAPGARALKPWIAADHVAATFTVSPGQSIQAAVDRCQPGDRVEVEPGIYRQSVVIDRDGVTLVGVIRDGERRRARWWRHAQRCRAKLR